MRSIQHILFIGLLIITCPTSLLAAQSAQKNNKHAAPAPAVNTAKVTEVNWAPTLILDGSLRAYEGALVKTQINGTITKIYFHSGQTVKAGDPLVQIYPNILQANLNAAIASFHLAKVSYQRQVALYRRNNTAKADVDQAKAAMLTAQSQVNVAKVKLEQSLVRAPFPGRLGVRFISVGEYVKVGQELIDIQNMQPTYVDFSVPQAYLASLKLGQKVEVALNAYPKETFTGKVTAIGTRVDQDTRAMVVRATLPANAKFVPGAFVQVTLYLSASKKSMAVPLTAVVYDSDKRYVYVVKNNKATKTAVTLGRRGDKTILIKSGLTVGECVVVDGVSKLKSNTSPIKVISGC